MRFLDAKKLFENDKIRELANNDQGLRFLKLRSLSRKASLEHLFAAGGIEPKTTSAKGMLTEAYDNFTISTDIIEQTIRQLYKAERVTRIREESHLVSELYKLKNFDWGGLHQNSLEKTIVDNYVKKSTDFNVLNDKIDNELLSSMRGYVLCSWYNHWTSILIEDVFRDHSKVLPAVGKVKKIDFFINNVPFDLKVTYLPEGLIKDSRKNAGVKPELTVLRGVAKELKLEWDRTLAEARLIEDLWQKLSDHPSEKAQVIVKELDVFRLKVLIDCQNDSTLLIRWLYENQGVRRFDAANRLFLVLVDKKSFFDSWKLKRAKPLLVDGIIKYLDAINGKVGKDLDFEWEGRKYNVTADVVFIVPPT